MGDIGLALLSIGIAVFIGVGIPAWGYDQYSTLLEEYRKAVEEGLEPTLDQKNAHAEHVFYRLGEVLVLLGAIIWVISALAKFTIGD